MNVQRWVVCLLGGLSVGMSALAAPEHRANPGQKLRARGTQDGVRAVEARDITVRLFSTAPVRSVELVGSGARVRLCTRCVVQALGSSLPVAVAADGRRVDVNGRAVVDLFVEGEVRARTEDGRVAQVAGRWRVAASGRGVNDGLHVTVEVPSERYVMAVLAAEAAADEPTESLKALAVVARSFAMRNQQRHGAEGLCDSTHCQALRFGAVPARVREAVETTAGETLWLGVPGLIAARQVEGYFTQDCGGMTEDAAAAWGGERQPWLPAHADPFCARQPGFWHARLRLSQVRAALASEGIAVPEVLDGLQVLRTDESGRVAELEVSGGAGPVRVKAATLRFALDRTWGWNELRSDWYRMKVVDGWVVFDGRGYGHGVGLCQAGARGMAALGKGYREILWFYFPGTSVRVLAGDAGWGSRPGNGWTLRAVSNGNEWIAAGDEAWARARGVFPGAKAVAPVVTVYPTTELFREGIGEPGWELGATRGTGVDVQPGAVVSRASCKPGTGNPEPGHPASATTRQCGDSDARRGLLLHEFLHVLVESEASEKAPLWLREGLVEVLAGERCGAGPVGSSVSGGLEHRGLSTPAAKSAASGRDDKHSLPSNASGDTGVETDIRAGLRVPGSQAESQRAHAAACARVRGAVDRFGQAAVREWLRNGVPAGVGLEVRPGE